MRAARPQGQASDRLRREIYFAIALARLSAGRRARHGAIVEDPDGNTFLDFAAGIAVCSTGHCHPKVVEAIQKQAAELIHIAGTDFYHRHMPQLAERLVATMPKSHQWKVFFGNSGTEAVEGAIKLARYATQARQADRVLRLLPRAHPRLAFADRVQRTRSARISARCSAASSTFLIPTPIAALWATPRKPAAAKSSNCSSSKSSSACSRRKKLPRLSWSRFKAKAASFPRRHFSCRNCSASATSTASC